MKYLRRITLAITLCATTALAQIGRDGGAAQSAIIALQNAGIALETAQNEPPSKRVAALTSAIRAYETGLTMLRSALRDLALREATVSNVLQAERAQIARLLGAIMTLSGPQAQTILYSHPKGPLASVHAGMLLADASAEIRGTLHSIETEARNLAIIKSLETDAQTQFLEALEQAQNARETLGRAIAERTPLPAPFAESKSLYDAAQTLDMLAESFIVDTAAQTGPFAEAKGTLTPPVFGALLLGPNEANARGTRHPGIHIATRAQALVTLPWSATVLYRGKMTHYGNVILLEPEAGYLLIFAGLAAIYPQIGENLTQGAPIGLMPAPRFDEKNHIDPQERAGVNATETLYIEIRKGATPENPMEWLAAFTQQE